jgi:class 3 adenylate cyclase/predicted ATPase
LDIAAWLREQGLERYIQAFEANDVDAAVLRTLTADDLKELGVTSLGHRKKLLEAIAALAGLPSTAPLGEALATAPETPPARQEAERRQLTLLFCDLVGSTELSARLDPEDMRDVIRAYQIAVAGEIGRFEGHVAKFMGDGVLAYFGYPRAHEDEVERAVRAGLALADVVGRLKAPTRQALAARVGIATGQVVVGDLVGEGAAQEQAVVGETPNLAARLQGIATPGQVVIAATTRRLLGAGFELEELGERELKGISEPVQAFAVTGERPVESRFEARSGPTLLPMVGRDQELALLLERWTQAKGGEGQGVLLVGEAGIGKSRVSRALLDAVADEPHNRVRYQCSPYHTDSALWPAIQQLNHAAGLGVDDPVETKLDKLEVLLGRAGGRDAAPLIADLLNLEGDTRYGPLDLEPQVQRSRTLAALVDQLLGLAARQSVLVVLEDAHWIDPTTLELIEQCLDRIAAARVLILLTSRPDRQPQLAAHPHVTRLTLNRLGRAGVEAIVARLGADHLPSVTIDTIIARADGVPLFVEELTKAVLETGETSIPASLHDSLMARLDRIPEIKEVAQTAACIGRDFDYPLLAAIADRPDADLAAALDKLAAAELIYCRGRPPEAGYTFKHALVRDTAYASLLRRRREEIHARIARTLEREFSSLAEASPELLARHFTEASLIEQAIPFWLAAGEKVARRSANVEAIEAFRKGLDLVEKLPEDAQRNEKELAFQLALGPVLMAAKGLVGADVGKAYVKARELCELLEAEDKLWPVVFGLWRFHLIRGEVQMAKERAHELSLLAKRDQRLSIPASWAEGAALFWSGEPHLAQPHFEQVVEAYESERHHALASQCAADPGVVCNGFLAWTLWMRGYPEQALNAANLAMILAQAVAHPHSVVWATCFSAQLRFFCRDLPAALSQSAATIELANELVFPHHLDHARAVRGWALVEKGHATEGAQLVRQSLDASLRRGQRVMHHWCLAALARASLAFGDASAALGLTSEALEVIGRTGARWWESELHRLRGELLMLRETAMAQASFEEAIEVARRQCAKSLELRAATSLARLWAEHGERQKARDLLAPLYAWFTEGFDTADLKDARALLDELS